VRACEGQQARCCPAQAQRCAPQRSIRVCCSHAMAITASTSSSCTRWQQQLRLVRVGRGYGGNRRRQRLRKRQADMGRSLAAKRAACVLQCTATKKPSRAEQSKHTTARKAQRRTARRHRVPSLLGGSQSSITQPTMHTEQHAGAAWPPSPQESPALCSRTWGTPRT